jgi:hypothetical protein
VPAIVHPINSSGSFETDESDSPFVIDGSYLERSYYSDSIIRDEMRMTFVSIHRPLTEYTEALANAGFLIERMREPDLPNHGITNPGQARWQRLPLFLHIRAIKYA